MKRRTYIAVSVGSFALGALAHCSGSALSFLGRALFDLHDVCAHEARVLRVVAERARR